MSLLIVGYMLGYGRKLKAIFWGYLVASCLLGLVFMSNQVHAYSFNNYCGDGELSQYEECDDGNNENGDGCNHNCYLEEETATGDTSQQEDEENDNETPYALDHADVLTPTATKSNNLVDVGPLFQDIFQADSPASLFGESSYFRGNNMVFYRATVDMIEDKQPTKQRSMLSTIRGGLKDFNQQVLKAKYSLDLDGLLGLFSTIMDLQADGATSLTNSSVALNSPIQRQTPHVDTPSAGSPVVFWAPTQKHVSHMDWHFGNGRSYGCDRGQCSRVPVTYTESGTYNVQVKISFSDGTDALHRTSITIGEEQPHEDSERLKQRKEKSSNILRPGAQENFLGPATYLVENNQLTLKVYPMNHDEINADGYTIYSLVTDKQIDYLQRNFGNGKTHSCSKLNCQQVPVVYKEAGDYQMRVTIRFADGKEVMHSSYVTVH